jgi:L-serine dehydratase
MSVSVFDLFKIGIGPSSSHTVGPMRAARAFVLVLQEAGALDDVARVQVELFGSLGATGKGHATDTAILLGLQGEQPHLVEPDAVKLQLERIREEGVLHLLGTHQVTFNEEQDLLFRRRSLPYHPNGMQFCAFGRSGEELLCKRYYSVGGGFVVDEAEVEESTEALPQHRAKQPYPFDSAEELLELCDENDLSISDLMMENEKVWRSEQEIREKLLQIWEVMQECVRHGLATEGELPGVLRVRRRAPELYRKLTAQPEAALSDPLTVMDWVNLYALAVNEENAAGGRVVTAPTNGAAGIIPAVLHYWTRFVAPGEPATSEGVVRFLLAAGAIGLLYKKNASISGADVGCQGEVGVACSMAAAGLAEARGGTPAQVENAAEIGMEHNLGLTCDPVGGLVQIPCIERNAMGAVKAINAARIALHGSGEHYVSLDKVIKTMRETGADMKSKYKETSRGGLAVNVIEC